MRRYVSALLKCWGLRDYGTAQWEGGDRTCDHKPSDTPGKRGLASSTLGGGKETTGHQREGYKGTCPRCGAVRVDNQLGLEDTPEEYVANMVAVFREVRRVLRPDGVLWLNLGDSYNGSGGAGGDYGPGGIKGGQPKFPGRRIGSLKPKDLVGIPWRVALALQADGWYLRAAPPWIKANPMPESVTDRPGTAHEYIFLLTKSKEYFYDVDAVRMPGTPQSPAALSWNRSGKHSELTLPGQSKPQHRPDRKMVTEMYPADKITDPTKGRPSGVAGIPEAGRNRRTNDWWNESLDHAIAHHLNYVAHLQHVKEHGGMLLDEEGDPLGLMVNTKPFSEAHFAVWPEDLVEPMILAGTSPQACPHCSAPWERVTEKERTFESGSGRSGRDPVGKNGPSLQGGGETKDIRRGPTLHVTTTGWQPTCSCEGNDGSGKCRVLDIFHGSGTTGRVAMKLGRSYWGCELNPEYVALSIRARLTHAQPTLLGQI